MSENSEVWHDSETGTSIVNESDVPLADVIPAFRQQHPEMAALVRWSTGLQSGSQARHGTLMNRDRYVTPDRLFDQFRMALDAAENDDVVSGVLESTEALAFNGIKMSCGDEQEEDIWDQIIENIELDALLRQMWREIFTVSQFYAGIIWETKDFKVSKKTKSGNKSKKSYNNLYVPKAMTILDPLKVVPVGSSLFGQTQLAYIATEAESLGIDASLVGRNTSDQIVNQLITGKYNLNPDDPRDKMQIQNLMDITGLRNPAEFMYLLNPNNVFRHTATKPDYQRYASVRMKSVFELLDLKHQLRQMDRVFLLGATNFIVLVKKGTDAFPAKPNEVETLATQIRGSARLPVIVADHRVEIEIITPKMDMTLKPERYNTLDARITARLYQIFMTGAYSAGTQSDDSIKLARVVARGMESRRYMIIQSLNKYLFKPTFEQNVALTEKPQLNLHPKRISLDFDNNIATFMQDLRDRGDISRETLLSEVDIDQADEALKREREKDNGWDDIFTQTNVPFNGTASTPGESPPVNPKTAGRRGGGNSNGGGMNRQSGVSQPGRGTVPKSRIKNPGKNPASANEQDVN